MNIKQLQDKVIKSTSWAFGISLGLLGIVVILSDNSVSFNRYLDKYPWIYFIAGVPLLLYIIAFLLVLIFVLLQYVFVEYHNLRDQGNSPERALFTVIFLIIIIVGLIYLSLHFGRGSRFTE